jgi:hypothetical protein
MYKNTLRIFPKGITNLMLLHLRGLYEALITITSTNHNISKR